MIRRLSCLCATLLLAMLPSLLLADGAAKQPPPNPAALKAAAKLVDDVYKDDLAAAKTPDQKALMAKKLLDAARDERDSASRFALFTKARDVASETGDIGVALVAIDGMDAEFNIDALKMKADTAKSAANAARTPGARKALAQQLSGVIAGAVTADRYDIAVPMAEIALSAARATGDSDIARQAAIDEQQVRETEAAYTNVKRLLLVLADKPANPEANLKVGQFRCFIKGEWEKGLPMLTLGNDAALKALAEREIAGAKEADAQVKLGDAWWDVAGKSAGAAKKGVEGHAANWYQEALPTMEKGLERTKVEHRIAEYNALVNEEPPASSDWIDLLKIVDPKRDTVRGGWKIENAGAVSGDDVCVLQIPYTPPEEYDFRYSFTRHSGTSDVVVTLKHGSQVFGINWNGDYLGFDTANNVRPWQKNGKGIHVKLVNGQKHTVLVEVRKASIRIVLDDKASVAVNTEGVSLDAWPTFKPRDADCLCIVSVRSPTTFHSVEIKEVTGQGKVKLTPGE